MELKSTYSVGINPTHGKRSDLKISLDSISDFIAYLQENKIKYEEKGVTDFVRTLDQNELSEIKDKVLDLTLESIPEKELRLANFKDFSKQKISELQSEITVSETERKSLSEIAKKGKMIENAENIIVCKTNSKSYFFGKINYDVELLKVEDYYCSDIFQQNDDEKINELLHDGTA